MEISEDILYIENTLKGDVSAFEKLVLKYNSMVFTLALRVLKNHEDAEEVTQDVFVKVYSSLDKFHFKSKFSTWIYKVTYHNSINFLRAHKKHKNNEEINEMNTRTFYVEQTKLENEEDKKIILDSIMKLPEIERVIITLYYYEDLSVKEISEITTLSDSNVKSKLFRARQKLYDDLKEKNQFVQTEVYE